MFAVIKIAGLSAVLSAGLVSAFDGAAGGTRPGGFEKRWVERAPSDAQGGSVHVLLAAATTDSAEPEGARPGRNDRLIAANGCAAQAWPYVAVECMAGTGQGRAVRTITVGRPNGADGTTLVRIPADSQAAR